MYIFWISRGEFHLESNKRIFYNTDRSEESVVVMTQKYGVLNARTRRGAPGKPRKEWSLFFLVLPWLILTIVFCYLPIAGWSYAFIDFRLGRPVLQSQFVGLDNFKLMFSSISRLPRALRNTLVPNGINLALSWMPIAFAICLNELRSGRYRKCV